jgi:hypothetical protein
MLKGRSRAFESKHLAGSIACDAAIVIDPTGAGPAGVAGAADLPPQPAAKARHSDASRNILMAPTIRESAQPVSL